MMQKYRAFWKSEKKMIEVRVIDWNNQIVDGIYPNIEIEFENITLMQSTGQKDCNNSDIFDADILLEPWRGHVVGRVFYSLGDLAWKVLLVGGGEEFLSDCVDLQVIGNIYENPDLLEGLGDG